MADGITEITTRRGYDIRDFSLLACGGGGALCGAFMAELLNTKNMIVPRFAASFCAWSMFCLDIGRDYLRTFISNLDQADPSAINNTYQQMIDEALSEFNVLHVKREDLTIVKSADVRYAGQFHEIELNLPAGEITAADLAALKDDFHRKHDELFTFSLPNVAIEFRNLRLIASVKSEQMKLDETAVTSAKVEDAVQTGKRMFL